MRAALELECIGDDAVTRYRELSRALPALAGENPFRSPWVARLTGLDDRFGFTREFLKGQKGYARANSIGSRGVYLTFWLEEGWIYEVFERLTWKRSRRYFVRSEDGRLIEMTRDEVREWLSAD